MTKVKVVILKVKSSESYCQIYFDNVHINSDLAPTTPFQRYDFEHFVRNGIKIEDPKNLVNDNDIIPLLNKDQRDINVEISIVGNLEEEKDIVVCMLKLGDYGMGKGFYITVDMLERLFDKNIVLKGRNVLISFKEKIREWVEAFDGDRLRKIPD